jgi:hypothetical protein
MVAVPDASALLVGATRSDAPATRILSMTPDATFALASLTSPRRGAAATWVPGRGLFVFGGSATAPAVEVLAPGTSMAIAASFPSQNVAGAAATALDGDRVLVAWANGAAASFLTYDLSRPDPNVAPVTGTLPCPAAHFDLFGVDAKRALGIAEKGDSCAFLWDGATVTPVPLKVARRGARALRSPTGAVIVVGGSATLEEFTF